MRKTEDEAVAALVGGDGEAAWQLLQTLLTLDRRRAWWALFRAAARPSKSRSVLIALVARTYIARRGGRLIGVSDHHVVGLLARAIATPSGTLCGSPLQAAEVELLSDWLPKRLRSLILTAQPHPPRKRNSCST